MSRTADSGAPSGRKDGDISRDRHSSHRDRDTHRERDSVGHGDGRRDDTSDDRVSADAREDRSSRHRSRDDGSSEDDKRERSSRSHRSKRTRDHDSHSDSDTRERKHKHKKHDKDKKREHRNKHRHTTPSSSTTATAATDLDQRIQQTKQQLALLAAPTSTSSSSSIPAILTADDYYARSAEFRLWLHYARALHLDELEGERARALFNDFISDWNSGKLAATYYRGVDSSTLSGGVLTGHKWRFVGALSEEERLANASVRDSVDSATHHRTYQQEFTPSTTATTTAATTASANSSSASSAAGAGVRSAGSVGSSASLARPFGSLSKGEKRQHIQRAEALMDEVAPRETGREAMLLKRREKSEYSRRERGGDGMDEVDDDVLMGAGGGGGQSELARLKERDSRRRESRNEDQVAKRSEWDRKERERMKAMLQSIGQADKYNI